MSNRTNGSVVAEFERAFAQYVGAQYAIACCNGTATLHTALVALGVKPGDRVAVPPLTMASTTLAVLHAGAVPKYIDVDARTWLMEEPTAAFKGVAVPVDLYGLHARVEDDDAWVGTTMDVEDAAQTLRKKTYAAFTSYSFQASKIISLGEGGMLVTNDGDLTAKARQFRDLGYPTGKTIARLKTPTAIRHEMVGWNYRMADLVAAEGLCQLTQADEMLVRRRYAAECYRQAIDGCEWITPQYVPEGWPHSYWTYAIALRDIAMWELFVQAIQDAGGERPYAAWRLTYQEPAFRYLAPDGTCPVAEDLQPRLVQLQTNHRDNAESERAAACLRQAIASCAHFSEALAK